jgi:hypothetical protein
VSFLAPKVVITPLLIASASLAGRRWGAMTSGWLLALPLTSGPIALFISLDLGSPAGVQVAAGSLLGATAQIAFCLAYAAAASRFGWPGCLAIGGATFAITAVVLDTAVLPAATPPALFVLALAAVLAALATPVLRAGAPDAALSGVRPGRWDIPARAFVATVLVLAISGVAPFVGGRVAGILATFPVYVSVLTTFAHRIGGSNAGARRPARARHRPARLRDVLPRRCGVRGGSGRPAGLRDRARNCRRPEPRAARGHHAARRAMERVQRVPTRSLAGPEVLGRGARPRGR